MPLHAAPLARLPFIATTKNLHGLRSERALGAEGCEGPPYLCGAPVDREKREEDPPLQQCHGALAEGKRVRRHGGAARGVQGRTLRGPGYAGGRDSRRERHRDDVWKAARLEETDGNGRGVRRAWGCLGGMACCTG